MLPGAARQLVTFFKNHQKEGDPHSDSRSVERGGAQAAARIIIKWGAYAAAPALKEPLIKPRAVATAAFRDGMREARCSQWPVPLASRATKQTARKATVPQGCGKMRRLRRCAPRLRSPGYDLRRAPCILPHFASNAIRGGLNQRFLQLR